MEQRAVNHTGGNKMMKRKHLLRIAILLFLAFVPNAFADENQLMVMIEKLQKQMAQMQTTINEQNEKVNQQSEKIRQLESRGPQIQAAPSATAAEPTPPMSDYEFNERLGNSLGGANKWLKDLKFSGDIRLRYEAFDYTNGTLAESDPRNRFRYRLRFGFEKKFKPDMKAGFYLASGEPFKDPTSTNETLDGLFTFKPITIERVYAIYNPSWAKIGPIEDVEIGAGKFANPFERASSEIIWDRDVRPEGAYEKVNLKLFKNDTLELKFFTTAGQFILDEDSKLGSAASITSGSGGDAELWAMQGGFNPVFYVPGLERPVDFTSAVSYYSFRNYADYSNFIVSGTSFARGNTNVIPPATQLDAQDFEVVEIYHELAIYPFGIPSRFFFDFARNVDEHVGKGIKGAPAGRQEAWALGVKLGNIAKKGDWEAQYQYRYIEPNSAVGAFNDSDFGDGHSNRRGSAIKLGYALTDNLTLNAAAYFVNNVTAENEIGVLDQEQRRFQLDLVWKF